MLLAYWVGPHPTYEFPWFGINVTKFHVGTSSSNSSLKKLLIMNAAVVISQHSPTSRSNTCLLTFWASSSCRALTLNVRTQFSRDALTSSGVLSSSFNGKVMSTLTSARAFWQVFRCLAEPINRDHSFFCKNKLSVWIISYLFCIVLCLLLRVSCQPHLHGPKGVFFGNMELEGR